MVGSGLDELSPEQRSEALRLIVESVIIDRDNSVHITWAIESQELVAIDPPPTLCLLAP